MARTDIAARKHAISEARRRLDETYAQRRGQLDAELRELRKLERNAERDADHSRAALLARHVLALRRDEPALYRALVDSISPTLSKPEERALFGLEPLPDSAPAPARKAAARAPRERKAA